MSIIAIIPARGGSKGIPRKNLVKLCGKPLIQYTIEEALKSKHIRDIYVSSEDKEILLFSKSMGVKIIKRPAELAEDYIPTVDVVIHAINVIERNQGKPPKVVVTLQPTSPLRTFEDIDNAIELFMTSDADSLVSVTEFDHPPQWGLIIREGYLVPFLDAIYLKQSRQKLQKVYRPNGAIFISTSENLRKFKTFFMPKTIPFIMPRERSIDIDTEFDLKLAEFLLRKEKKCEEV